jgi:cytochrome c oxidase subunit 3
MPTTLTKEEREKDQSTGGGGFPHDLDRWTGGGGDGPGRGGDQDPLPEYTPPPEGYRIAIWLTLVSVSMLFLALASVYVFRGAQLHPLTTPKALWVSTMIILLSSVTMEMSRRSLRRRREKRFQQLLGATMALGIGFLISQIVAWRELVADGFYINRNVHSGLAYIFTGLHAAHVIGGLLALAYVMRRSPESWTVTALYWHFIDGIWVALLALVFLWK